MSELQQGLICLTPFITFLMAVKSIDVIEDTHYELIGLSIQEFIKERVVIHKISLTIWTTLFVISLITMIILMNNGLIV